MTEQQYKELLQTLGINAANSNLQIKELLEAKLNEYLDRTDAEAEQKASDVQDALDYAEDLIVKMGGGIALAPEETEETEEGSRNSFADRTAGRKGAITYTSSSAAGGATTTTGSGAQGGTTSAGTTSKPSHPWFYSTTGDKNIEDLFKLAEGDLAQGDFQHAKSVYDTILRTEMTNAGAYMGKVLARYKLQEPKDIATCFTQGLETDSDLKRVENCGNDKQKKFIQDALEERRQAMIYMEADKVLNTSWDVMKLLQAAAVFDSIATYRDSSKKADDCRKTAEHFRVAERKQQEEERKRREEEKRRKEEERHKKEEEARRKDEERRRRHSAGVSALVLMFLIIVAVLVYVKVKNDTGGNIEHAFHFGNMNVEGGDDIRIGTYPYITSITVKDVTGLGIGLCDGLKEVTVQNSSPVEISSCDALESLNISGSVEEITVKDCVGLKYISISENFTGNIDIINCDSLDILELPDDFAGSIDIEGCDNLREVEAPESARSVYVIGSKYIEDGHIH